MSLRMGLEDTLSENREDSREFDKDVLRELSLPEDYVPESEEEAMRLVIAALED